MSKKHTAGLVDSSRPVRDSEKLDVEALERWIASAHPELAGPIELEQFPNGHSNLTYLLKMEGGREVVLRRPPFGAKIKSAHDMGREHRILSALVKVYDKVPRPLAFCEDEAVLGAPFYLMERVRGVILRGMHRDSGLGEEMMGRLSETLVDNLAELHAVDLEAAGLTDFGRPDGYVRRQVEGWTRRWEKAKTDEVPSVQQTAAWLGQNMPPEVGAALIHNDYKYDNLVLRADDLTEVIAVLDWEMATVGDPLMDLGTALGYWITADDPADLRALPFGPTILPGNLSREQVVQRYGERSGLDVSNFLFYYVFGIFKITVIIQQIYARYRRGLTDDPRFAGFGFGVQMLGRTSARAIDASTIGPVH